LESGGLTCRLPKGLRKLGFTVGVGPIESKVFFARKKTLYAIGNNYILFIFTIGKILK
jgi:hypothetical protein